jgi:hypothetical protein
MRVVLHGETITCDCGAALETVPMEGSERSRFAFEITHKRDGRPIKDLESKGAVLGVLELGWCDNCQHHAAIMDTIDDPQEWAALPKWHKRH